MTRKKWIKKLDSLWGQIIHKGSRCEFCGKQGNYNAHHLKRRSCLSTRFYLPNGVLLCIGCHFKIHASNIDSYALIDKLKLTRGEEWWVELEQRSNRIVKWGVRDFEEIFNKLNEEL